MTYTVIWRPAAVAQLAQIWIDSTDRAAVTTSVNSVERLLRVDPHAYGESRAAGTRIAILRPVVIRFSVSEADRLVEVLTVHQVPRAGK